MWGLWGSGIQVNGGFASLGLMAVRAIGASRGLSYFFFFGGGGGGAAGSE